MSGFALVLLSAASFSTMAVLAPLAYRSGVTPSTLLFLRFMFAGVVLIGFVLARGQRLPRGRQLLALVLMGGVWYVVQTLAYFIALGMISPGLAVLLLYLYPSEVTIISALVFRRKVTPLKALVLCVALLGTLMTVGPAWEGQGLGILLALGAATSYAGYIVVSEVVMREAEPLPATAVITFSAGVAYGGVVLLGGFAPPNDASGWWAVLVSVVCSIVALGGFFAGLSRIGAADAAILSTVEPVITVVLSRVLLGEAIDPIQMVGGACILGAVVLLARLEPAAARGS